MSQQPSAANPASPGTPQYQAPRAPSKSGRSPARTVLITCLSLVLVFVLLIVIGGVLLWMHLSTPEHEQGVFDQRGGHEPVDDPCARLQEALPAQLEAEDFSEEWETSRGYAVTCEFTVAAGEARAEVFVGWNIRHQPLILGEDRSEQLDSAYENESAYREGGWNENEVADRQEIHDVGERAKTYTVWARQAMDGWWDQHADGLYGIAQTQDNNAVIRVEIAADLPFEDVDADDFHTEDDFRSEISDRFDPPTEEIAGHTLVALA